MNIELVNNDLEQLTLTDVSVGGASVFSTSTTFNSGQSTVVTATVAACGAAGQPYQYNNITITYTKGTVTGLKEVGQKGFVGKCS
jgi:uncharacterized protein YjdB